MLSITLEGPPFERGYQHGRQFSAEIEEAIHAYCPDHWLTSPEVQELERRLLSSLAAQSPELVAEMVGISKGAKVSLDQVTLLNLVLATNDLSRPSISETFRLACSAIGMCRSDVGPLVAKNCDETKAAAPFYLLQTVYPDAGLAFIGISWVGTLWLEGGMNEAGFALMQTAGPLVANQDGYGIVCNIAPRLVLAQCRSSLEAMEMFRKMRVAGWGMGAVLADLGGQIIVIEKTYDRLAVRPAQAGVGFCTNHFLDPIMSDTVPIAHPGLEANSKTRHRTLTTLFTQRNWPHTLQGMKAALAYHGQDGFVCQHGDAELHSNYSCIAILEERKILVGDGYPCRGNYKEYHLYHAGGKGG